MIGGLLNATFGNAVLGLANAWGGASVEVIQSHSVLPAALRQTYLGVGLLGSAAGMGSDGGGGGESSGGSGVSSVACRDGLQKLIGLSAGHTTGDVMLVQGGNDCDRERHQSRPGNSGARQLNRPNA